MAVDDGQVFQRAIYIHTPMICIVVTTLLLLHVATIRIKSLEFCPKDKMVPSRELTYPVFKALLKMIFLFPRWDMYPFPGGYP